MDEDDQKVHLSPPGIGTWSALIFALFVAFKSPILMVAIG
jgi:hypothetical protein